MPANRGPAHPPRRLSSKTYTRETRRPWRDDYARPADHATSPAAPGRPPKPAWKRGSTTAATRHARPHTPGATISTRQHLTPRPERLRTWPRNHARRHQGLLPTTYAPPQERRRRAQTRLRMEASSECCHSARAPCNEDRLPSRPQTKQVTLPSIRPTGVASQRPPRSAAPERGPGVTAPRSPQTATQAQRCKLPAAHFLTPLFFFPKKT